MPLARYFFFVGGLLLALLFASDAIMPKSPVAEATAAGQPIDKSVIRIHSDRKWPERIVFDTNLPTIVPAALANAEASAAPAPVADVSAKVRVRESFAQLPPDAKQLAASEPKKPELKLQRKRRIAKIRVAPPAIVVAQQPRFGFFDNGTW